jgi:hypothetical protein
MHPERFAWLPTRVFRLLKKHLKIRSLVPFHGVFERLDPKLKDLN